MEYSAAAARRRPSSLPVPLMLLLLLMHAVVLSPSAAAGAKVTALIVFGDSTVDTGNNDFWPTLVRSNYPPYGRDFPGGRATGRFCNGRMTPDFYSEKLGLGRDFVPPYLDPSYSIQDFAIGVNFASAGAGIDDATTNVVHVIPLSKQLEMFREYKTRLAAQFGAAKAEAVVSGALFLVSIGSNDFLENYFVKSTPRFLEFTVAQYVAYLVDQARGFLTELHSLGARKLGFAGLGPLGCLPPDRLRFMGLACDENHNAAARAFTAALQDMVTKLRGQLPDADFRVGEVYNFVDEVVRQPANYGFLRADVGCCGIGLCIPLLPTCLDANTYFFWDIVHPTQRANQLIADYIMNTTFSDLSS